MLHRKRSSFGKEEEKFYLTGPNHHAFDDQEKESEGP